MWADAGHLAHHDNRRSRARYVHSLADPIERNVASREIVERIVLFYDRVGIG
jgi:hypothetical protein